MESNTITCETCRHFRKIEVTENVPDPRSVTLCFRYPPQVLMVPMSVQVGSKLDIGKPQTISAPQPVYPMVSEKNPACGEYSEEWHAKAVAEEWRGVER